MRQIKRLTFINNKSKNDLNDLWENSFYGQENDNFMHEHVPQPYRVPSQSAINSFLSHNNSTCVGSPYLAQFIGYNDKRDFIQLSFDIENYIHKNLTSEIDISFF